MADHPSPMVRALADRRDGPPRRPRRNPDRLAESMARLVIVVGGLAVCFTLVLSCILLFRIVFG